MEKINFIDRKKGQITIGLEVVVFEEDNKVVIYSPALDLSSYGKTEQKAQKAFEHDLSLFLEYTTRKQTLEVELLRLGWKKIPRKKHKFLSPDFEDLKKSNQVLDCIVASKQFNTAQQNYAVPV